MKLRSISVKTQERLSMDNAELALENYFLTQGKLYKDKNLLD